VAQDADQQQQGGAGGQSQIWVTHFAAVALEARGEALGEIGGQLDLACANDWIARPGDEERRAYVATDVEEREKSRRESARWR
jgi:hypothetical protein